MASSLTRRGTRVHRARKPFLHAACASAAPRKDLPTPVAPMAMTFCLARTHWHVARLRTTSLSRPRPGSHQTSSRHALIPSLASFSRRVSRRFSRSVHSRSTTSPSFSSKDIPWPGAIASSSRTASAIALSLRSQSFWIVCSSIIRSLLPVEIDTAADVLVMEQELRLLARHGHRRLLETSLQDHLHALAVRRSDRERATTGRIDARGPVLLARADEGHALAVAVLGVR